MEDEDLTHVSWKDTAFIQAHGLNEHSVMPYFALSQFYDKSSINEQISMQARFNQLEASQLDKRQMTGLDYELVYAVMTSPSLFIITKSMRRSPTQADVVAAYYVIEGTIYQAPDLHTLTSNRILNSLSHVQKTLTATLSGSRYHPAIGSFWESDEKFLQPPAEEKLDEADLEKPPSLSEDDGDLSRKAVDQVTESKTEEIETRFLGDTTEDRNRAGLFAAKLDALVHTTWGSAIEPTDAWEEARGSEPEDTPTAAT
ncbi:MED6 mediator sub complex component-domain-containing protein [Powellomyces hirtus]|nr:MED6 mediator sub complex component-domain-containing protein [Powellomyces hirtus]